MSKPSKIRLTFSPDELREYYEYLGGKIGALQDRAAIRDMRPSEISQQVTDLKAQQDKISEALRKESEVAE